MQPRLRAVLVLILVAAAAVRLPNLTGPLIGWHSWRQADTASMARYYHRGGFDLGRPQVAWGGAGPGIVESEFPIYSFLVAALYQVTGESVATARTFSILLGLLTIGALFVLVRRTSGERVALWVAGVFALLPLNAFYGRVVMPEPLLMLALVSAVLFFARWCDRQRWTDYGLSIAAVTVAVLIKPPVLVIGAPLAYLALRGRGLPAVRDPRLWLYALVVAAALAAWYLHAHRLFLDHGLTFGIWDYGRGKWGDWSLLASWDFWNKIIFKHFGERFLAWFGLPLVLFAALRLERRGEERLFDWWLAGGAVGLLVVSRGNYVHEYYQLPLIVPLAFYLGRACDHLTAGARRPGVRLLGGVALVGMAAVGAYRLSSYLEKEEPGSSPELALARAVRGVTGPHEPLVLVNGGDPTTLYLADRHGWILRSGEPLEERLAEYREQGARVVALLPAELPQEFVDRARRRTRAGEELAGGRAEIRFLGRSGPEP